MGDKARLKRIDYRTATVEEMVRDSRRIQSDLAELTRETREIVREMRAEGVRHTQALEDQRVAINQWNLRQEKMMREVVSGMQESIASLREARREGLEEARAQRAALFAMIDELKRGGGPAAA